MEGGAAPEKLILGMGTYGRSFTLQRGEVNGLGAPAPQKGQAGPYTREGGSLGYNEVRVFSSFFLLLSSFLNNEIS